MTKGRDTTYEERIALVHECIKEIRVRKDYEISITLNASFNQVEQLKAVSTYDGAEIFEEISQKILEKRIFFCKIKYLRT